MAEPRDSRVSAAYRELPGEGPPPALDAAIQAAARRAVGSRPAAGRRWQKPLSIAAVFMLAVAVSLQVERDKPVVVDETPVSAGSAEYPVSQAQEAQEAVVPAENRAPPLKKESAAPLAPPAQAPPAAATQSAPAPETNKRFAPDPSPAGLPVPSSPAVADAPPSRDAIAPSAPAQAPAPQAAAGAAARDERARPAPPAALRAKKEASREVTLQEKAMSEALDTPERGLERIAELRARGLHDEADRALAEFRRARPGYRISEEWLRKVERR